MAQRSCRTRLARVLIIRQENLDRLPEAAGKFFGFDSASVEVEERNHAENKPYAAHYRVIKESLRLPDRELEEIYSLPHVRHFYSHAEIETFKQRWRRGLAIAPSHCSTAGDEEDKLILPFKSAASSRFAEAHNHESNSAPLHSWTCRPCAKCALQLHSIPSLQQASNTRLALLQQLNAELNAKVPLVAKCRALIRRLFGHNRSAA